jgi:hypothetical protein
MKTASKQINEILSKFDNGLELYQNNAMFANCVEHLLRGGDVYKILEQIIIIQQKQQKEIEEIMSSVKIRLEKVASCDFFDELIKECKHDSIKREDGLDECLDCGARNY